jgi:proline iminopeptidase
MKVKQVLITLCVSGLLACAAELPAPVDEPSEASLENGSFKARLNGFGIHYEVHGEGPVLMVLSNSWGVNIAALRALFGDLESHLTMVYFDPRGMGESDPIREESDMGLAAVRADFDALRRHLGLETVNALGWSNGAMNLVTLASEKPETLSSAIFLHGAAAFTEKDNARWAEKYPDLMKSYMEFMEEMQDPSKSDAERTAALRRLWLEEFFPLSSADPEGSKAMLAEVFKDCPFSWSHADYSNRESSTFDNRDRLPKITCPSLIIQGRADMIPVEKSEEMARGIPNSRMVVLEDTGHFGSLEEPEAFRKAVLEFLQLGGQ